MIWEDNSNNNNKRKNLFNMLLKRSKRLFNLAKKK